MVSDAGRPRKSTERRGKTWAGQGKMANGPKVRERGKMNRNPFLIF
jgi:hypothetical protein